MGSENFKEMQRVYYYDGLFLTADLCITDQRFFRDMMLYHNQALFSSGTACGLNVTASSTGSSIIVSAGMAIDSNGNQLIWPASLASTPIQIPNELTDGSLYIYIQYNVVNPSNNGGQPNLILECPTINFAQNIAQITDQNLILAEATIENQIIQADSLKDARVGVSLNAPVNSSTQSLSGSVESVKVNGSVFSKFLAGSEIIPPNSDSNIKIIKLTFAYSEDSSPVFTTPPKINATVCTAEEAMFALTLSAITTSSFTVSVMRVDSMGENYSWEQPLTIEWFAYQPE